MTCLIPDNPTEDEAKFALFACCEMLHRMDYNKTSYSLGGHAVRYIACRIGCHYMDFPHQEINGVTYTAKTIMLPNYIKTDNAVLKLRRVLAPSIRSSVHTNIFALHDVLLHPITAGCMVSRSVGVSIRYVNRKCE